MKKPLAICHKKNLSELVAGEAIVFVYYDNPDKKGLIFGCPKCGRGQSGTHEYDEKTQSLSPSIVCAFKKDEHPCGYHGYLKNGFFTEC